MGKILSGSCWSGWRKGGTGEREGDLPVTEELWGQSEHSVLASPYTPKQHLIWLSFEFCVVPCKR